MATLFIIVCHRHADCEKNSSYFVRKAILTLVVMLVDAAIVATFFSFFSAPLKKWKSFPNTHANDIDNKYRLYSSAFAWGAPSMEHDTVHRKKLTKNRSFIKWGYKFIFILTMCKICHLKMCHMFRWFGCRVFAPQKSSTKLPNRDIFEAL